MEQIIRKFPRGVRRKATAEIRDHCCNLWHKDKCLLLDNGVEHRCTQLEADSIKCIWFRDAVLPGNPVLLAEIKGEIGTTRTCKVCGSLFKSFGNRALYCEQCKRKVRRNQATVRQQRKRALCHAIENLEPLRRNTSAEQN